MNSKKGIYILTNQFLVKRLQPLLLVRSRSSNIVEMLGESFFSINILIRNEDKKTWILAMSLVTNIEDKEIKKYVEKFWLGDNIADCKTEHI